MCLDIVFDEKRKNSEIKKLKTDWRGYVKTWKVIEKNENTEEYCSPYYKTELHKGINIFNQNDIMYYLKKSYKGSNYLFTSNLKKSYKGGTHLFISKKDTKNFLYSLNCKIIKCKVKKKWINTVGTQRIYVNSNTIIDALVLVCAKAILPEFKKESKFKKLISNLCKKVKACV